MLATYYTLSKDNAPTPEEMRQKSRDYMLMNQKNQKSIRNQRAGICKGKANSKGRHCISREMIWINVGHAQMRISRSSRGGLHDI